MHFRTTIEINGYTGVVVEIINGSLKIRSQEEVTRSYNAAVLKKLYGQPEAGSLLSPVAEAPPGNFFLYTITRVVLLR